jgi:hypothetical protein
VRLLVRPEALRFAGAGEDGLRIMVTDRRFAGASTFYLVATASGAVVEVSATPEAAVVGQPAVLVPVSDPADRDFLVRCFPAEPA